MKPCDRNPTFPLESNKTHQQSIYNHHIERESSSSYDHQESEEKTQQCNNGLAAGDHHQEMNIKEDQAAAATTKTLMQKEYDCGRERLKRHRVEVAGRVWIPDIWGQEELLKDCIDCSAFDAPLMPNRIMSARQALVEEGRRATSGRLRIENRS